MSIEVIKNSKDQVVDCRLPISLIIPFSGEISDLEILITYILDLDSKPSEVIIVDTNLSFEKQFIRIDKLLRGKNICFEKIDSPNSYPGKARNLGALHSTNEIIAFLDVKTLPAQDWIINGYKKLTENSFELIWGQTFYKADSIFEKAIRASTYGIKLLKTVPGSILYKNTFYKIGSFIETTRAGEDGEWIWRSQLININTCNNSSALTYSGLIGQNLFLITKKWFRNYVASYRLPHLRTQKDIYFYFMSIVLLIIAFNWNNLSYDELIRGWDTNSWLYVPNITKISLGFILIPYIFVRSVFLPLRKGASTIYLVAGNMFLIFLISFVLDLIKAVAFVVSKISILLRFAHKNK